MKALRADGWGIPGRMGIDRQNVDVHLSGVCTCRWRKDHCVPGKRCAGLFGDGGSHGETRILRHLMGKKFPKVWASDRLWKNIKQLCARSDAVDVFEKKFFKWCRPVKVRVETK